MIPLGTRGINFHNRLIYWRVHCSISISVRLQKINASPGFFSSSQDFASLRHSIASLRHSAGRSVHRSSILWTERPEKHRFAPNPGRSIHGINHPYTERPIRQRRNTITDRTNAVFSEQKELVCTPMAIAVGIGEQIAPDCTPKGTSAYCRELKGLFCTPKALATGIGERIAPDCTPKGPSAYCREQKGLFCTPKAIAACLGEQIAPNCTPKGFSAYCRELKGLFCTQKELATGIGEQKVAVCTPLGRRRRRRNNSFRSGWRKRERHRELDGELLLIRAARARNVRQTKRRHGLKGPQVFLQPFLLRPPLPAQAHPRPFFANSLQNCSFSACACPIICSPPVQSVADKRLIVSEKMKIGCVRLRNRL